MKWPNHWYLTYELAEELGKNIKAHNLSVLTPGNLFGKLTGSVQLKHGC